MLNSGWKQTEEVIDGDVKLGAEQFFGGKLLFFDFPALFFFEIRF